MSYQTGCTNKKYRYICSMLNALHWPQDDQSAASANMATGICFVRTLFLESLVLTSAVIEPLKQMATFSLSLPSAASH